MQRAEMETRWMGFKLLASPARRTSSVGGGWLGRDLDALRLRAQRLSGQQ